MVFPFLSDSPAFSYFVVTNYFVIFMSDNRYFLIQANVSISAAAIQQHLSKNLSLGDPLKAKSTLNHKTPLKKRQKPKHVESSKKCSSGMLLASHSIGEEKILDPLPKPTTLGKISSRIYIRSILF